MLIYELLDEILDFGYAQSTTTETLKAFVYSDPVTVDATTPDSFVEKMIVRAHAPSSAGPAHFIVSTQISKLRPAIRPTSLCSWQTPGQVFSRRRKRSSSTLSSARRFSSALVYVHHFGRQRSVLFLTHAQGSVLRAEIDGSIVMKSFLRGNPELRLGLNEDLVLGKGASAHSTPVVRRVSRAS